MRSLFAEFFWLLLLELEDPIEAPTNFDRADSRRAFFFLVRETGMWLLSDFLHYEVHSLSQISNIVDKTQESFDGTDMHEFTQAHAEIPIFFVVLYLVFVIKVPLSPTHTHTHTHTQLRMSPIMNIYSHRVRQE